MNTMQIINDIKQKISYCKKNNEYHIQDLDFLTSKFSSLESIANEEDFDFDFNSLNNKLEECYIQDNLSKHIFFLRKEVISIENAFSDSPLFQKEIYIQVERIEKLNGQDVYAFSEILDVIKLFLPILRNKNEKLSEDIKSKVNTTENFIKKNKITEENIEEIKKNFTSIKDKIKTYFEKNPNAKKIVLGAGVIGLSALGFMVGKELYKTFRQPKIIVDDSTLIVAYYLSKYDHNDLFDEHIPARQAFTIISKTLDVKTNTLRSMRDYFDAFIEVQRTSRKGYANSNIPEKYTNLEKIYAKKEESEIKDEVLKILHKTN